MKHELSEHFDDSSENHVLQNARADQIRRLLQDIGFLPRNADPEAPGEYNDKA